MTALRIASALLLAALATAGSARAQDKPAPPPRAAAADSASRKAAPALSMPEYIITGSDIIRLREQTKRGIALLSPSDFLARSGRGTKESSFVSVSLLRPPLEPSLPGGRPFMVRGRAGIGMYATPFAEGWYAQQFAAGDIGAHLSLERSDGHVTDADYSRIDIGARGGSFFPSDVHPFIARSRIEGEARLTRHEYRLYANLLPAQRPALDIARVNTGIAYSAALAARRNAVLDYRFSVSGTHTALREDVAVRDSLPLGAYTFTESRIGLRAEATKSFWAHPFTASVALTLSDLTRAWPDGRHPVFFAAELRSRHAFREDLSLEGGVTATLYRGSRDAAQGRLYPFLAGRYAFDPALSVFARIDASVREVHTRALFDENPYAMLGAELRHRDTPVHVAIGAEYDDRHTLAGRVTADYSASTSLLRWSRASASPQQWEALYDGTSSIFALQGEGAWTMTPRDRLLATAVLRSTRNDALDGPVPFLADVELSGRYSHDFPFGLTASASLHAAGARTTDDGSLPAVLLASVEGEYRVTPNFGVFLSVDNLSAQRYEWWPGYEERPLTIAAGITVRF
ncbi:MAG: hypothetical protein IPP94_08310 [Ignavibacteria bacterium]|nr:hypothetical protein [Ignavibacteria bacterium]